MSGRTRAAAVAIGLTLVASAAAAQGRAAPDHGWIGVSVGVQSGHGFTDSFDLPLYAENERLAIAYPAKGGPAVFGDAGYRVWRKLFVGAALSATGETRAAAVSADLPHPFFFNDFRHISGTTSVAHTEIGVHGFAATPVRIGRRLRVIAGAGPSLIRVSQPLVTQVQFSESFPFDSASFTGATTTPAREWALGFNGRLDAIYQVTPRVGFGVLAHYSYARAKSAASLGGSPAIIAGGAAIAGGLRIVLR